MLGERDILGTQLIRRNDELALLYEKVKIQQSTLSRGQIQYRDRCVRTALLVVSLKLARCFQSRLLEMMTGHRFTDMGGCLLCVVQAE